MIRRLAGSVLVAVVTMATFLAVAEWLVPHVVTLRDVGASFTEHDPRFGKRLKPNFSVVRTNPEFSMTFRTNSLGLRGDEPQVPVRRPIVFLGDSFTMGYGVSNGEEFPAVIQATLRQRLGDKAPVSLNFGIGNSGNGFWLRHLEHTLPPYEPRLVVMEVLQNDFKDNLDEHFYELDQEGRLVALPIPPPSRLRQLQQQVTDRISWVANSNLMALARQAAVGTAGAGFRGAHSAAHAPGEDFSDEASLAPGDPLTLKIVEAAIQACRTRGWPVLVLSVGLTEGRRHALARTVQAAGALLLELPSKKDRPDLYFKVDGHWNVKGQAQAAQEVLARIVEMKVLDTP